ncbi:restriction endonuclease subunit S [Halomonas sp. KX33721]|jgi:type I restriction enzyme S subunit|uniref:restriction endonuclease subunit S n=1 Tax=Halomonas sp. KX33721 TaxID=1819251 RepID=UPI000784794D|nr:restriction endonuclease subunit S [Halomonas sp. KX33721]
MSELSFMEKLLDGAEVEWKALEEVCDFKNGFAFKSSLFKESGLPIVRITNVDGKNINLSDVKYFDPSDYRENTASYKVCKGDILIAMSGATTGKIGFYSHENPAYLNQRVGKFLPKLETLNNRYLYHYLLSKVEKIYVIAGGGAQPNLSSSALMEKIKIPVPFPDNPAKSLEIQAEIVRILDTFTELTAELTAELSLRKKQYNHYRDQLLSFEEGEVEWKKLDEVSKKISSGGTPRTGISEYYDGSIPWLRTQEIDFREIWDTGVKITEAGLKNSSAKWIPENCVIVAMYGATVGKVGINKISMATNQACANIDLDDRVVNYRYVFHYLTSEYEYIKSLGTGSQTNINAQIVKSLKVPIPYANDPEKSLAEQARIVTILDKFDTLTTSISEGLPREIELRQKQYEYYRDLLLSFPKSEKRGSLI